MSDSKVLNRVSPSSEVEPAPQRSDTRGHGRGPTPIDPSETPNGGGGLVRVTVNLTPAAVQALEALCEATGYSKTDVINRSLQVYEVWQELAERNGGMVTVRHKDGETEKIRLL